MMEIFDLLSDPVRRRFGKKLALECPGSSANRDQIAHVAGVTQVPASVATLISPADT